MTNSPIDIIGHLTVSHGGRVYAAVTVSELQVAGVPDAVIQEALRAESDGRIEALHGRFLTALTRGASLEERDTWRTKEAAARAYTDGSSSAAQTSLLTLEATGRGISVGDLVGLILDRADAYMEAVGLAGQVRGEAWVAVEEVLSTETLVEAEAGIDAAVSAMAQRIEQEIATWRAAQS